MSRAGLTTRSGRMSVSHHGFWACMDASLTVIGTTTTPDL